MSYKLAYGDANAATLVHPVSLVLWQNNTRWIICCIVRRSPARSEPTGDDVVMLTTTSLSVKFLSIRAERTLMTFRAGPSSSIWKTTRVTAPSAVELAGFANRK